MVPPKRKIPKLGRPTGRRTLRRPSVQRPSVQRPPVQRPPAQRPPVQRPPVQRPPAQRPPVQRPSVQRTRRNIPIPGPPTGRLTLRRRPVQRPPVQRPAQGPPVQRTRRNIPIPGPPTGRLTLRRKLVQRPPVQRPPTFSPMETNIREKTAFNIYEVYSINFPEDPSISYMELPEVSGKILPTSMDLILLFKRTISEYIVGGSHTSIGVYEYIISQPESYVDQILEAFNLKHFSAAPIDLKYTLLWYLHYAHNPMGNGLTPTELEYISSLSEQKLRLLLPDGYEGPSDSASLIFAIVSGSSAPNHDNVDPDRYREILKYSPLGVWKTSMEVYNMNMDHPEFKLGPYFFLGLQNKVSYEAPYASVTAANVEKYMDQYQIMSGVPIPNIYEVVDYFRQEIKQYGPVFDRPDQKIELPILTGSIPELLAPYTLIEIVTGYDIDFPWRGRQQLMDIIVQNQQATPTWSWSTNFCNNDDTMNIVEVMPHGEMDKTDVTNPTLSYGVIGNYRCYQVEELLESWIELGDGTFSFAVPDWSPHDPDVNPTFPIESIHQLAQLLDQSPDSNIIQELKQAIQTGIAAQDEQTRRIKQYQTEYQNMNEDQQWIVQLYLVWVFTFGFWMRFWKGPGFPWPTTQAEIRRQAPRNIMDDICPIQRDENSLVQHQIYHSLKYNYSKDPVLKPWIEGLPQSLTTDWKEDAWTLGSPLSEFIERLTLGACQQGGGKYLPMSGYFWITRLFGYTDPDEFNDFMNYMIPTINEMELDVIKNRLEMADELGLNPKQRSALKDRLRALQIPFQGQPPFDPNTMDMVDIPDTD